MNRCTACSYHICRVGEGGDYTMKRRLSWEIQMSNSAHWEVCWCVNLVSLKQIYDTFPFFLNLPYAYCYSDGCSYYTLPDFSHFWCQHVDEYSLWAKRSSFRLLCLRPFFLFLDVYDVKDRGYSFIWLSEVNGSGRLCMRNSQSEQSGETLPCFSVMNLVDVQRASIRSFDSF